MMFEPSTFLAPPRYGISEGDRATLPQARNFISQACMLSREEAIEANPDPHKDTKIPYTAAHCCDECRMGLQ